MREPCPAGGHFNILDLVNSWIRVSGWIRMASGDHAGRTVGEGIGFAGVGPPLTLTRCSMLWLSEAVLIRIEREGRLA